VDALFQVNDLLVDFIKCAYAMWLAFKARDKTHQTFATCAPPRAPLTPPLIVLADFGMFCVFEGRTNQVSVLHLETSTFL
jgi:hypothetical protein